MFFWIITWIGCTLSEFFQHGSFLLLHYLSLLVTFLLYFEEAIKSLQLWFSLLECKPSLCFHAIKQNDTLDCLWPLASLCKVGIIWQGLDSALTNQDSKILFMIVPCGQDQILRRLQAAKVKRKKTDSWKTQPPWFLGLNFSFSDLEISYCCTKKRAGFR
jgi:hypothetical protein